MTTLQRILCIPSCAVIVAIAPAQVAAPADAAVLRYTKNDAFGFGERLEYDVGYKFISAGTAVFSIAKNPVEVSGRPCFEVSFVVASHKSLEFIYKVRDSYTTWLDVDGIFPWKFEQITRESNFSKDYKAEFNQVSNKAITTEGTFDVPEFVHDIVSAFFYVRTFDLKSFKKGQVIQLQNFFDRETHELSVKILGRQRVTVDAGTFDCVVIEPIIVSGSPFAFKGRLLMWMTADDRKIPVKVSTQIPIGSIDAKLTSYRGTRGAIDAKVRVEE